MTILLAGDTMRVAIYRRVSKDKKGLEESVDLQDTHTQALVANRPGWVVVEVFTDNDFGASNRTKKTKKNRPAWNDMIARARAGEFDVILAYSQSRLTRRPREFEDLVELGESGIQIVTVKSMEHNYATADGRGVARTVAAWDAAEAERTAERVTDALAEMAKKGRRAGKVPYGWRANPVGGPDLLDDVAAGVIREAARRMLAGESRYAIVQDFNRRGLRTVKGGEWDSTNLRLVMLRERNCGRYVYQGKVLAGQRGDWPAILTDEEQDRVTNLLTTKGRAVAHDGSVVHLLSGLVLCGKCETGMRVLVSKGRANAYYCVKPGCHGVRRKQDDVEAIVVGAMLDRLSKPDAPALLGGDADALAEIDAALDAVDAAEGMAWKKFKEGRLTEARYDAEVDEAARDRQVLMTRRRVAEPMPEFAKFAGAGARAAWDAEGSISVKRALIQRLLVATVYPQGRGRDFDHRTVKVAFKGALTL